MKSIAVRLALPLCILFSATFGALATAAGESAGTGKDLFFAVQVQDLPSLKALLSKGGDANFRENGRSLLGWAAQNGNVAIVEALIEGGAKVNGDVDGVGHTPLMRAIETQQVEIVKVLLKAKADPNAKNSEGESCLMMGVESRKPEIVQELITSGADVKFATPDGDSPALTAAIDSMTESLEILKILGKAKANLNISNAAYTPLSYAVGQSNMELVETLLQAGADPNAQTKSGNTPLIDAVSNGNVDIVKLLLAGGADPNRPNGSGSLPLQVAETYSTPEIAALLKGDDGKALEDQKAPAQSDPKCDIAAAAGKQMELHGLLQAQVSAGKMSSDIFRTFNEDTKGYARMLAEDPSEACKLFERLKVKYGV